MTECIYGYESFCNDIESYFQKSDSVIQNKRNIIKIVDFKDEKFIVKSFKRPNFINRFVYRFFRDSKAKRSYQNGKKLLSLNIFTPKPIGYIEEFIPLLNRSYYISEYFEFDFEIREVLDDIGFDDREKILREFVSYSYMLHQKGVYHIDYSPGNVLIKKENNSYKLALVDLNRMKFIEYDNELRFKNLSRFSAMDEDTLFIAKEYANISNIDEDFAIDRLFFYHKKHQQYLDKKRKMKALKLKGTSKNPRYS